MREEDVCEARGRCVAHGRLSVRHADSILSTMRTDVLRPDQVEDIRWRLVSIYDPGQAESAWWWRFEAQLTLRGSKRGGAPEAVWKPLDTAPLSKLKAFLASQPSPRPGGVDVLVACPPCQVSTCSHERVGPWQRACPGFLLRAQPCFARMRSPTAVLFLSCAPILHAGPMCVGRVCGGHPTGRVHAEHRRAERHRCHKH